MTLELTEKDRIKNALLELTNRVPQSIVNAKGVQEVRDWKDMVTKARKAAQSNKSSLATLQGLYTNMLQYK